MLQKTSAALPIVTVSIFTEKGVGTESPIFQNQARAAYKFNLGPSSLLLGLTATALAHYKSPAMFICS